MKKSTLWLSLLLSLSVILNGTLLYRFLIAGSPLNTTDQRTTLPLEEGERELVLSEMRQFLVAIQGITQAANKKDMNAVADYARAAGQNAAATVPASLKGKLPLKFKQLGSQTHRAFDTIALDAESLGDDTHALNQLGQLMNNCIACHASYQIRTSPVTP